MANHATIATAKPTSTEKPVAIPIPKVAQGTQQEMKQAQTQGSEEGQSVVQEFVVRCSPIRVLARFTMVIEP